MNLNSTNNVALAASRWVFSSAVTSGIASEQNQGVRELWSNYNKNHAACNAMSCLQKQECGNLAVWPVKAGSALHVRNHLSAGSMLHD